MSKQTMKKEFISIQSDVNPDDTSLGKQERADLIEASKAAKEIDPANIQGQTAAMQLGMQIESSDSETEASFEGFSQKPTEKKQSTSHSLSHHSLGVEWDHSFGVEWDHTLGVEWYH